MSRDDAMVLFADIARDLARQPCEQAVLDRVVTLAVELVEGCDDAGVMLVHHKHTVETASVSSPLVRASDEAQARHGEGPCFDAALNTSPWKNQVYHCDDTATELRWPSYLPEVRELGVGSMLGFQLFRDDEHFGALDVYGHKRRALDLDSQRVGWVLASHAAVALNSARTDEQLRTAIATRQEIGQAMGMLSERYQITGAQAFELLKRISQDGNTKLNTVAATLVRTGRLPGQEA